MTAIATPRPRRVTPVVLAGGNGSRLWPLSRPTMPKQFLRLTGPLSPFQETILRVRDADRFTDPVIVIAETHRHLAELQMREIGVRPSMVLAEPTARNTAPAIIAAALAIGADAEDSTMLVLPSDHLLRDAGAFHGAVDRASELVQRSNLLVTFGITPTRPETGYGYIRRGKALGTAGTYLIDQFVEKPDRRTAAALLKEGTVDWNSGMFCFPVSRLLEECRRLVPLMVEGVGRAVAHGKRCAGSLVLDAAAYKRIRGTSIDYAIMEKTDCAGMVSLDTFWSDVGSWDAVWETAANKDVRGNAILGDAVVVGGENNYVRSEGPLTTVLGLDNVAVVVCDDAVLVAKRDQAQNVKGLVDLLTDRSASEAMQHRTVTRPWGCYTSIDRGEGFQVKHITVVPGGRLSLQLHRHRSEHWTVVSGQAQVTVDGSVATLGPNESVYIPLGAVHRLENYGDQPVHLIEVQCGTYLGEDDIVRLDDVYGRDSEEQRSPALAGAA